MLWSGASGIEDKQVASRDLSYMWTRRSEEEEATGQYDPKEPC